MRVPLETGYCVIINEEWRNVAVMHIQDGRDDGSVQATALTDDMITDDVKVHICRGSYKCLLLNCCCSIF